jgi:hypothetical protein
MCRRIQAAINDGYGPASVAFGVLAAADTVLREADSEVVDTDALRSSAFEDSE